MGMLQGITTSKATDGGPVNLIDVIGDKSAVAQGRLLSSVLWDPTETFVNMIQDVNEGKFGSRPYTIGLADGSVRLLKTPGISEPVWGELEKTRERILKGELKVPLIVDAAQVRALMTAVQAPSS
jgi:simple sugar transport system substrate-binding protein